MAIKDLGLQVEDAWKNLRPMTKEMLVEGLEPAKKVSKKRTFSYDAHADWEISRLLDVLDEHAFTSKKGKKKSRLNQVTDLAEVCAKVLEEKTQSAEIFIQLAKRALSQNDFSRIDTLADALLKRFTASEIAEIIRQSDAPQIRAIGYETLAVTASSSIQPLLKDPLYFEIACTVLEQQAMEFEMIEAAIILEKMDAGNYFK